MLGNNPIRPPEKGDGSVLSVQDVFPTIQGEGPLAGTPAVFVRLGGCNLACDFCDTEFESFRPIGVDMIVEQVKNMALNEDGIRARSLVVLTGGEPLRQPVSLLCDLLIKEGFRVQLETNGTLYRPLHPDVEIVCSPKNTGSGYTAVRDDLLDQTTALKFVVSAHHPKYREVKEVGQKKHHIPVYVQPMDEKDPFKNAENLIFARALAAKNGYILSLQLHKLMGMP